MLVHARTHEHIFNAWHDTMCPELRRVRVTVKSVIKLSTTKCDVKNIFSTKSHTESSLFVVYTLSTFELLLLSLLQLISFFERIK